MRTYLIYLVGTTNGGHPIQGNAVVEVDERFIISLAQLGKVKSDYCDSCFQAGIGVKVENLSIANIMQVSP